MESFDDVAKWVREHDGEGSGISNLEKTLNIGLISGKSAKIARAWLDDQANGDRRRTDAELLELSRRSTEATETSALAAVESAKHAGASARWAKWAVFIAVAALAVSGWPFINELIP